MKHGQRWSGQFNEVVGSGPFVWDDDTAQHFHIPSTNSGQPETEAQRIAQRLADAVERSRSRRQRTGAPYFVIPKQEA